MAGIWKDVDGSVNNVTRANSFEDFVFRWAFVSFTGEIQEVAEVRWRKGGLDNLAASGGISSVIKPEDNVWSPTTTVQLREDMTTWVLSGGQYVPPASGRRYYYQTEINIPGGTLSEGIWYFQVRFKAVGETEFSGWTQHKVEISKYEDATPVNSSSSTATFTPKFEREGVYGVRVVAISAAGIEGVSAPVSFNVWNTNRHVMTGGGTKILPEYIGVGTSAERVTR